MGNLRRQRAHNYPGNATPGTFHGHLIEPAMAYDTISPGNGGQFFAAMWDEEEEDFLPLGAGGGEARQLVDPNYVLCAGTEEVFWVIFDTYRQKWMPLGPHGLIRKATLNGELEPEGVSAGSTILIEDRDGNTIGEITADIHSPFTNGDTAQADSGISVAFIPSTRKWWATTELDDD
jgi:hypothetical protein